MKIRKFLKGHKKGFYIGSFYPVLSILLFILSGAGTLWYYVLDTFFIPVVWFNEAIIMIFFKGGIPFFSPIYFVPLLLVNMILFGVVGSTPEFIWKSTFRR